MGSLLDIMSSFNIHLQETFGLPQRLQGRYFHFPGEFTATARKTVVSVTGFASNKSLNSQSDIFSCVDQIDLSDHY